MSAFALQALLLLLAVHAGAAGGAGTGAGAPAPAPAVCATPAALSTDAPNVLMIGDSVSMGPTGYALFVQDLIETASGGALGVVQHGGGMGWGGQMASSADGAAKVRDCMGNHTGTLKPEAWSVITYNAGLHDCALTQWVSETDYTSNLRAVFETLKPAASAVLFVTTNMGAVPFPARADYLNTSLDGITVSCVNKRNAIARQVAKEVGGVGIAEMHDYVAAFCKRGAIAPAGSPFAGVFFDCSLQACPVGCGSLPCVDGVSSATSECDTGEHFFNRAPFPSGQQYTALAVAEAVVQHLPANQIQKTTTASKPRPSCQSPAPLAKGAPNALIINDEYGYALERVLQQPRPGVVNATANYSTGKLAATQVCAGANATDDVSCVGACAGSALWDTIVLGFSPLAPAAMYDALQKRLAVNGSLVFVASVGGQNGPAAVSFFSKKSDVRVVRLDLAIANVCGATGTACGLLKGQELTDAGGTFAAIEVAHALAPRLGTKWSAFKAPPPATHCNGADIDAALPCFVGLEECSTTSGSQQWAPISDAPLSQIRRASGGCITSAGCSPQTSVHPPAPWTPSCSLTIVTCNASDNLQLFSYNKSTGVVLAPGGAPGGSAKMGDIVNKSQCFNANDNSRSAGPWLDVWEAEPADCVTLEQHGKQLQVDGMCVTAGIEIKPAPPPPPLPPPPPPPTPDTYPGLRTIGSYDLSGGEMTPFMWNGQLLIVETVGWNTVLPFTKPSYEYTDAANCTEYAAEGGGASWSDGRCPFFRIRQMEWDSEYMSVNDTIYTPFIPGSSDISFCNAILRNETGGATLWVFGTNNDNYTRWGGAPRSQVHAFWSTDLASWKHSIALNFTAFDSDMQGAYNVDVTSRPDGTSVMAIEKAPGCCVTYFAECKNCGADLSTGWVPMPDKYTASGLGETANPTIRYLADGYYYLLTARAHTVAVPAPLLPCQWSTMLGRSKDLIAWEESPHLWGFATDLKDLSIVPGSALDKLGNSKDCMPYCDKSFTEDPANDINRSDMDFVEIPGDPPHVFVAWVTGNQGSGPAAGTKTHTCPHDCGMTAAGVVNSSLEEWLQSYFKANATRMRAAQAAPTP